MHTYELRVAGYTHWHAVFLRQVTKMTLQLLV